MPRASLNHVAFLCQVSRRTAQRWAERGRITLGPDHRIDTDQLIADGLLDPARANLPLPRAGERVLLRDVLQGQQEIVRILGLLLQELRSLRELLTPGTHQSPC
jgi:hypothetical protein